MKREGNPVTFPFFTFIPVLTNDLKFKIFSGHWMWLMLFVTSARAQVGFIDAGQGLSNRDVSCIYQTRDGFMWFGTPNGLNRYDGYNFTTYYHNRESDHSISNSKINCIYEDRQNRLWIGTGDGLNLLDQQTGKFIRVHSEGNSCMETGRTGFTGIEELADGSILAATDRGKIYRINDKLNCTVFIDLPPSGNVINSLKIDNDSNLWLITNHSRIRKFDISGVQDSTFKADWIEEIKTLVVPGSGRKELLFVNNHLRRLDVKNGDIIPDPFIDSLNAVISTSTAVLPLSNGELWLGCDGGKLFRVDLNTHTIHNFSHYLHPYLSSAVTAIHQDMTGMIWVGTSFGIVRFSPAKKLFHTILSVDPQKNFSEKNSIRGIIEDEKGDIYIGGYSGLFRYTPASGKLKYFDMVDFRGRSHEKYHTYCLLNDTSGYIWIGSEGLSFYRLNKKTGKFEFPAHRKKTNKSNIKHTYRLAWDNEGAILLGSSEGVWKYDIDRDSLYPFSSSANLPFPGEKSDIIDLLPAGPDEIWVATYGSGLYRLHRRKGITAYYSTTTDPPLSHNTITDLLPDTGGWLWIGTRGGGLNRLHPETGSIKYYSKVNGLADDLIAGMEDSEDILWISTFGGLSAFNKRTGKFKNYYEKDGLTDNEFNVAAHCKTRAGRMYFGGLNGINAFDPGQLNAKKGGKAPLLYLTRIVRQTKQHEGETSAGFNSGQVLQLASNENLISFYFAMADYFNPLKNRFLYKLEGMDDHWIHLENQHGLHLKGLSPGHYQLHIRGINSEGLEAANRLLIPIEVSAALYQRPWFQWSLLLTMLFIVYALFQYRHRQQTKLQELRTKISSDLHDEVGSILTRISIKADLLGQRWAGRVENNNHLTEIAEASRLATSTMNDVLWSVDARNDKMGNLLDHMREHVSEILSPKNISFDFKVKNINTGKEIDMGIRQNLFLIFKEAIHNIAKHSGADKVDIIMENKNKTFILTIHDNGRAKESQDRDPFPKGQGLKNMQMRAGYLNAALTIEHYNGYKITLTRKSFC